MAKHLPPLCQTHFHRHPRLLPGHPHWTPNPLPLARRCVKVMSRHYMARQPKSRTRDFICAMTLVHLAPTGCRNQAVCDETAHCPFAKRLSSLSRRSNDLSAEGLRDLNHL
jgi:hypothetical protein